MKMISKLSLLTVALTLASCNEKVAPELQNSGVIENPTGPTVTPTEYYFSLENTSHLMLNYKLHKTGAGNVNAKCEVRSNSMLSNDFYRGNPAANDITCYFDAEELSLYGSGMSWKVNASMNTCEYIAYAPYSYYNRQPGDSSGSYTEITCANADTNATHVATAAGLAGLNITHAGPSNGGNGTCGDWLIKPNPHIPLANRLPFTPENDEELCRFNYKDKGEEKCDIGVINVTTFEVAYGVDTNSVKYTTKNRTVRCGGKRNNCVQGAIRYEDILDNYSKNSVITQTTWDQNYSKEYEFPAPIKEERQSINLINFRRDLASSMIDYVSSSKPYTGAYKSSWADPTFGKVIEPRLVDFYSQNMALDGTTLIDMNSTTPGSYWNTVSSATNQYIARPLAAEPFMGVQASEVDPQISTWQVHVNPYYTYYCLDTAMDIKARIRVMVRDWDRVFPSNSDLELISDLHKGSNARQDVPLLIEVPGDPDSYNAFNDRYDWEDYISMERDNFFTPAIYRPVPRGIYTQGYFDPNKFPNEDLGDFEAQ